jgi:predicted AAA+ superfamily ATPase
MGGFNLSETGSEAARRLWWRGGFPRAYLARSDRESRTWQQNFIRTFVERDIQEFGVRIPPAALRRLWSMLAHYHAQICNTSELSRSLGEAHTTVKRHIALLVGALVVRQISPWHEKLSKRQVKSPKLYIRDGGLPHALLDVHSVRALDGNPKAGASWEGFVVEEIVRLVGERNVYFWNTHSGVELDLLVMRGGKRYGVEMKYKDAPSITKSMRVGIQDLGLAGCTSCIQETRRTISMRISSRFRWLRPKSTLTILEN